MTKKYFLGLFALALLASCGSQTDTTAPIANEIPAVNEQEVLTQIDTVTEEINNTGATSETNAVTTLTQTYISPAGKETVNFTLKMNNDQIESVEVDGKSNNDISTMRMKAFADAINTAVSGKTLEEAKIIGVVGGSSLTTGAFKAALKNM